MDNNIKNHNGNALLIYGGGLCDCANVFMQLLADRVSSGKCFDKTFIGFFSFEALLKEEFIYEWNDDIRVRSEQSLGGFFGTCRGINLTDPILQSKAIKICKDRNISWIFVGGGDGSARQVAEISEAFEKEGIKFCFTLPLTIDGIEGGASIGMDQAVKISMKCIKYIMNSCLRTRNDGDFSVAIVELQGRNRDNILANVVMQLKEEQRQMVGHGYTEGIDKIIYSNVGTIDIFAVPANYEWSMEKLSKAVNKSSKPTLVLYSEGAKIDGRKVKKSDFKNAFSRKTRDFAVGHLSQVNDQTEFSMDRWDIKTIVGKIYEVISQSLQYNKSFSIVMNSIYNSKITTEPIDYFAKRNPKENQHPTLPKADEEALKEYIA